MRYAFAATLAAIVAAVAPGTAQAWTVVVNPTTIEKFGYGTGTGHTTTGNSSWTTVTVRSSDYNGSATHAVDQKWVGGSNGWQKQWDDGASLGLYETVTNDSELRTRFQFGSTGKAVGTYPTTWQFFNTGAGTSQNISLTAYVQPWNQCTDGVDNDVDGTADWKKGAGGSTLNADTGCANMNGTSEGSAPPPPPDVQCSDGLDNDADGAVDYPADPGCSSVTDDDESNVIQPPPGSWWKPTKAEGPFYWQLPGALNMTRANTVNIIDVDPDEQTAATIANWKAGGVNRKAICYVSAGTAEEWRTDYPQWQALDSQYNVLGNELADWPGEYAIDGEKLSVFRHLLEARADKCKSMGFDAIEWDNVDGFESDNWPETIQTPGEQLTYNRALAGIAHDRGMAAVLKNDLAQLADLVGDFDLALNEQCAQYGECGVYSVFLNANKPVLQAEYGTFNQTRCNDATAAGRWAAYFGKQLSGSTQYRKCWP